MPTNQLSIQDHKKRITYSTSSAIKSVVYFKVLAYLKGMTRAELAQSAGMTIDSVNSHVNELVSSNLLTVSGSRACRVTGSQSQILKAVAGK